MNGKPKYNICEPEHFMPDLNIGVGDGCSEYRGGDFLNAVDQLVSYFLGQTDLDECCIADFLELRAKHLRCE